VWCNIDRGEHGQQLVPALCCIRAVVIAARGDRRTTYALTLPARSYELKPGLPEESTTFDIGQIFAMSRSAMKTTRQLEDLGQNRRFEGISRDMLSIDSLYIHDLAATFAAAALKIGAQRESL
jgi:hypothetical protein